jgi:hypothetical protein
LTKPTAEPVDGSSLVDAGSAKPTFSVVINYEQVARFTIVTKIKGVAVSVLGSLASKSKIHVETLEGTSGSASVAMATRLVLHLGSNAGGANIVDWSCKGEFGDAISNFVGSSKLFITRMSKALMPQDAFGMLSQCVNSEGLLDWDIGKVVFKVKKFRSIWREMLELRWNRHWEKKRLSVAKATDEVAMDVDWVSAWLELLGSNCKGGSVFKSFKNKSTVEFAVNGLG